MAPLGKINQRSRHLLPATALAVIGCLGGCGSAPDDVSLPSASSPTTEVSTVPPLPDTGNIDDGTYLVTGFAENFEITAPDGWSADGEGLSKDDPDHLEDMAVFVGWWHSDHVPTDACAWQGALVEVDPSAKAFVDAMTAQTSTASFDSIVFKVRQVTS